jgi:glycerol-3-phosphate cytidylyltransferase-like family protein
MQCDYLIVGVCSDALVKKLNRETIMSFENRKRVVEAIKYVDEVIVEEDDDKIKAWENIQFNIIFKGDDWKGTSKWVSYEKFFKVKAVSVVYFPYTRNISSSKIRSKLLYE